MTAPAPSDLPLPYEEEDPLRALQQFAHRGVFHALGFPIEIETNSAELLTVAAESWPDPPTGQPEDTTQPTLKVHLGFTPTTSTRCPPATSARAHGHLLSVIADADNFAVCDLRQGTAFGWITSAALHDRSYLRYHFLEAVILCLLSGSRVTPLHAASISRNGHGILLCGDSGAGKSTLAYACARAGWTLTSDDASYLLWNRPTATIRGNSRQLRFRPSAQALFPELRGLALTPRPQGKPSIEVPTASLPHIATSLETPIHHILFLRRHTNTATELKPLDPTSLRAYFEASLFPLQGIRERQSAVLERLLALSAWELHYRDLDPAIACLDDLVRTCPAANM
jgi:hypothetical protein